MAISSGGTLNVLSGGTLDDATVASGGFLHLSAGATASAIAISGGTLDLGADALLNGGLSFTSGGTLKLESSSSLTNVISGFASGDEIDLASTAFVSSYHPVWDAGTGTLSIEDSAANNSVIGSFALSGNFTSRNFSVASDGSGGTAIRFANSTSAPEDFNGDGISDVLFRQDSSGDTGYYQLNSNGTLQGWHDIGGSSTAYSAVGTGDFNGDGISDVLFRNASSGDVGFYQLNNNGTLQGWHDIGGSSTAYDVAGVGDFNGDGVSDVLFRNAATGDTCLLYTSRCV